MVDIGRVHSAPPAVRRAEPPAPSYPSSPPPAYEEVLKQPRLPPPSYDEAQMMHTRGQERSVSEDRGHEERRRLCHSPHSMPGSRISRRERLSRSEIIALISVLFFSLAQNGIHSF